MSETIIVVVICAAAVLYIIRRAYLVFSGKSSCCSGTCNPTSGCGRCCKNCTRPCSAIENKQQDKESV
ncbi:MAG: hypothetical protein IKW80_03565 [Thermoguttaceae bacterium]|nr:hypothetical protein [Thermoguttaceae bacterium]